jgi:hypothetical protein
MGKGINQKTISLSLPSLSNLLKTICFRTIDLSAVEQLVEANQTRVIGDCVNYVANKYKTK